MIQINIYEIHFQLLLLIKCNLYNTFFLGKDFAKMASIRLNDYAIGHDILFQTKFYSNCI